MNSFEFIVPGLRFASIDTPAIYHLGVDIIADSAWHDFSFSQLPDSAKLILFKLYITSSSSGGGSLLFRIPGNTNTAANSVFKLCGVAGVLIATTVLIPCQGKNVQYMAEPTVSSLTCGAIGYFH